MGRPKLSLPLGDRTVLGHVVAALRAAGVDPVVVVIGPHAPELEGLAAGAHVLPLPAGTPDMRATVEQGLHWLQEQFRPGPADAWLLAPADHPALDPGVVRLLLAARQARPECSVFVPTLGGRRGHPVLIGWEHVVGIRHHSPGQGLNTYLRLQADVTCEVAVTDADIFCDLDTPEDYERLRRTWRRAAAP
jgi:CTP:molybdopterin cytidylyltransferase MocA